MLKNIKYLQHKLLKITRRQKVLLRQSATTGENKDYVDLTKRSGVINGFKNLRKMLQQHVGARQYWLQNADELKEITTKRAHHQEELEPRHIKDSVQEVIIPLGSNLREREKYLNFYGTVRFGKLLEDLDTLAGWVGFKYFKGPSQRAPFSLVTACVDRIDLKESLIQSNKDLKLTGFVSWVGRTSLEITILIDQVAGPSWNRLAEAVFVMVARALQNGTACVVNKLNILNEEEQQYFNRGESNKLLRKKKSEESLFKIAPTAEERQLIHDMFLSTLDPNKSTFHSHLKPEGTTWMRDTHLKNLIICHPQSRNLYNKIFGGFLMREAFELSWANTSSFIKSRPTVIRMDDIVFRKPVEVGSLLYLASQVVYTKDKYIQTRVHAEVLDPKTGHVDTTNILHFHFTSEKEFSQVIPNSYGEYMLYLDGRRQCPDFILNTKSTLV